MARNISAKGKISRRESAQLFSKSQKVLVKRNYAPGFHGQTQKMKRLSTYGKQLREKQKAKRLYHLMERQFRNYYEAAVKNQGDTSENLLVLLETRLDNAVYRLGLIADRETARQLVNHGHFTVNGKKVTLPSYCVKVGDEIKVKASAALKKFWQTRKEQLKKAEAPGWLSVDFASLSGKVIAKPKKEEVVVPFDPTLILEFYSR